MFGVKSVSLVLGFVFISVKCTAVNHNSVEESFKQCLISQPAGTLGHCLGMGAITKLQSLDSDPEFDLVDGLTLTRDQQEYREAYNFAEGDPSSFRSLVDSLGHVFSQRSMHWDMGFMYPGLGLRVAPSGTPGGYLEFVLDPHREVVNKHSLKEIGTGRLLARQFLLPFLLGFKFNVATIIPILFGLLALLAKKAIIVSKIALIISSAYGLATLLLGNNFNNRQPQQTYPSTYTPGYGPHYNRFPEDEYQEVGYRGMGDNQQLNVDQLKLYGNLQEAYAREDKAKGRNFAWSVDEKVKKAAA